MICPYCGDAAEHLSGEDLYGSRFPHLRNKLFWVCHPCDARVGCHADGSPLGSMANRPLRNLRMHCHELFDSHWLLPGNKSARRKLAYRNLAAGLGIDVEECHFGEFDMETCQRALSIIKTWPAPAMEQKK